MTGFSSTNPMNQSTDNEQILAELREIKNHLKNTTQPLPLSNWVDSYDLCQMLKISRRLLQSYRNSGDLEFTKIGGKIFFDINKVEKWLRRHESKKASWSAEAARRVWFFLCYFLLACAPKESNQRKTRFPRPEVVQGLAGRLTSSYRSQ